MVIDSGSLVINLWFGISCHSWFKNFQFRDKESETQEHSTTFPRRICLVGLFIVTKDLLEVPSNPEFLTIIPPSHHFLQSSIFSGMMIRVYERGIIIITGRSNRHQKSCLSSSPPTIAFLSSASIRLWFGMGGVRNAELNWIQERILVDCDITRIEDAASGFFYVRRSEIWG